VKLFVDASAIVAVLNEEAEAGPFIDAIDGSEALVSPISFWEASIAMARLDGVDPGEAAKRVSHLIDEYKMRMVPIGWEEARSAVNAFGRYGKGSGHAANLNLGDCFAYACAETNNARLLYKGDDFSRTDLA
jgi:ribonuclease VapC